MAPQRLEKIESAPGNGMGSEASNALDLGLEASAADRARSMLRAAGMGKIRALTSQAAPPFCGPIWIGRRSCSGHACSERSPFSRSKLGAAWGLRENCPPRNPLKTNDSVKSTVALQVACAVAASRAVPTEAGLT